MTRFDRLAHRMHKKELIMANAIAIISDRNIGDYRLARITPRCW